MIPVSLPAPIRKNDELIAASLMQADLTDSKLAAALWENYSKSYYRACGFRSVAEYMRERWAGTDIGRMATMKSRSVQRLIREYRLAQEIPLFKVNFDLISRSNRRLLAQVITPDNAEEWVKAAVTMSLAEFEAKVHGLPDDATEERKTQRLYLSIYPETRAVWERAKTAARKAVADEGGDPENLTDALCLEMVCIEFLATYEAQVPLLSD
jgi:hypothetical protein